MNLRKLIQESIAEVLIEENTYYKQRDRDIAGLKKLIIPVDDVIVGDAIVGSDGRIRTVSGKDIKKGFMGTTIHGDSHGRGLVTVFRDPRLV